MLIEMYLYSSASYFLYNEPNVCQETKLVLELNHISTWQNAAMCSGSLGVVKIPQPPLLSVGSWLKFSLRSSSYIALQPVSKSEGAKIMLLGRSRRHIWPSFMLKQNNLGCTSGASKVMRTHLCFPCVTGEAVHRSKNINQHSKAKQNLSLYTLMIMSKAKI